MFFARNDSNGCLQSSFDFIFTFIVLWQLGIVVIIRKLIFYSHQLDFCFCDSGPHGLGFLACKACSAQGCPLVLFQNGYTLLVSDGMEYPYSILSGTRVHYSLNIF